MYLSQIILSYTFMHDLAIIRMEEFTKNIALYHYARRKLIT